MTYCTLSLGENDTRVNNAPPTSRYFFHHVETTQLIHSLNQLDGFHTMITNKWLSYREG